MSSTNRNQFRLYTGNNLEVLAKAYATARLAHKDHFREEGFFADETVCVATQGMRVWLEHYLVHQGHVAAGIHFPFLRDAIDNILSAFMKGQTAYRPDLFQEDVLIWRIYRLLALPTLTGNLSILADYLKKEDGATADVRRYQLARKLAQLYYDYIAFVPEKLHPEVLLALSGKKPDALPAADQWQLTLWQMLCKDDQNAPVISPAEALLRFLGKGTKLNSKDYKPITFFGVSAMAPYFLLVLKKLSTVQPVNFFYLNHCDDLWDDVKANWEHSLVTANEAELDRHFAGNSLLGNFGIQGREFFKVMLDEEEDVEKTALTELDYDKDWEEIDAATGEILPAQCILEEIQNRVKTNTVEADDSPLPDWDDSLTIHSCFNEIREVEALQDCLLNLIQKYHEENRHLAMNDIIVMAPDISKFAPAIQSVFGRGPLRNRFCISDRSVRSANLLAETFSRILDLEKSRFEVSRITALLDSPPLRARFGFEDDDVEKLRGWLLKSGIRWGRDQNDRATEGGFEEYSWQYGLDRLLLKLAVDGKDAKGGEVLSLGDLAPVDYSSSGDNQRLLASFVVFIQELGDFVDEIQAAKGCGKSAAEWCALLKDKRQAFFKADSESTQEYSMLGKALDALEDNPRTAGVTDLRIPFETIRTALATTLDNPAKGEPFLNGKITFCSLLPMRGIPCKIIALLGMDVGAFPRQNDATGFNLVNRKDANGNFCGNLLKYYNRSRSIEDRFTFLEALMSARDYLMIFYKGQDDQTLKELVAAAPVCELMDYARTIRKNADEMIVSHRLNAFDPKNFRTNAREKRQAERRYDGILRQSFSFDGKMAIVANAIQENSSKGTPPQPPYWVQAFDLPLPDSLKESTPQERDMVIELATLERFLKNPAEGYAINRLGLPKTPWEDSPLSDYEPFAMDSLNGARLRRTLGPLMLDQAGLQELPHDNHATELSHIYQQAKSNCALPVGEMGRMAFLETQMNAWIFHDEFREEWKRQENSSEEEFLLDLGEIHPGNSAFLLGYLESAGVSTETLDMLKDLPHFTVKLHASFKYLHAEMPGLRHCFLANTFKGRQLIPFYLKHLMLSAQLFPQETLSKYMRDNASTVNGMGAVNKETLDTLADENPAKEQLRRVVEIFLLGQYFPLPLFGDTSPNGALKEDPSLTATDLKNELNTPYCEKFFGDILSKEENTENDSLGKQLLSLAKYCYNASPWKEPKKTATAKKSKGK